SMREHGAVRGTVAGAHRLEQRGMEPPAVLVRALEVHLGWPPELRSLFEDGGMTAARVEPDVEDVALLAKFATPTLRTGRSRRHELLGISRVPLVGARTCFHDPGHVLHHALVEEQRVARRAIEGDDRHTPHPLARDHPLRSMRDHVVNTLL